MIGASCEHPARVLSNPMHQRLAEIGSDDVQRESGMRQLGDGIGGTTKRMGRRGEDVSGYCETARNGAFQQERSLNSGIHHGDRFSRESKLRLAAMPIETRLQSDLFSRRQQWVASEKVFRWRERQSVADRGPTRFRVGSHVFRGGDSDSTASAVDFCNRGSRSD